LTTAASGGSYYAAAEGNTLVSDRLVTAAGAFAFVATVFAWYMLTGLSASSLSCMGLLSP
jgi:hypothetical protein